MCVVCVWGEGGGDGANTSLCVLIAVPTCLQSLFTTYSCSVSSRVSRSAFSRISCTSLCGTAQQRHSSTAGQQAHHSECLDDGQVATAEVGCAGRFRPRKGLENDTKAPVGVILMMMMEMMEMIRRAG